MAKTMAKNNDWQMYIFFDFCVVSCRSVAPLLLTHSQKSKKEKIKKSKALSMNYEQCYATLKLIRS